MSRNSFSLLRFRLPLILIVVGVLSNAARATDQAFVQFPEKSIGTVLSINPSMDLGGDMLRPNPIGPAAGKVVRPPGVSFGLILNYQGASNLSLLNKLHPDDIVSLDSDGLEVDGSQLKELRGLTGLRRLNLRGSEVSDEQLQVLQNLHNLQYLNLSQSQVTGAGLKSMKECHQLKNLNLSFDKVESADLKNLRVFPLLTYLDLTHSLLDDAALSTLAELKDLISLKLGENLKLDDEGVKHLLPLSKLSILYLNETGVSIASLATFKKMPKLDHLSASGARMTLRDLETLKAQLPHCNVKGGRTTPRVSPDMFAPLH